jgi:predicted DCC family thiol-disulfide oxidoreductase YuxK
MLRPDGTMPRGWLLYDGQCGFCTASVRRVQNLLVRRGFELAPLQSPWVMERTQLTEAELMSEMRLLLPDGRLLTGAEAYLYVMHRIWWAKPLALLFSIPGLNWFFHRAYRFVASHRYEISRVCRLPPPRDYVERQGATAPPPPPAAPAPPSRSSS